MTPPPKPLPGTQVTLEWVTLTRVLLPPTSHLPGLLLIKLKLGYFSLDWSPDGIAYFFLYVTRERVEYIKIAFRLVLVKLQHGKLSQPLFPFLFLLYFGTSKFESFMGRISECLYCLVLSSLPFLQINPSCVCNGITPLECLGRIGKSCLANALLSTYLAIKSETQMHPRE